MKELLRPADLVPLLGLSRPRIYQLLAQGLIPHTKVAGAIVIPRGSWEKWLERLNSSASLPEQARAEGLEASNGDSGISGR